MAAIEYGAHFLLRGLSRYPRRTTLAFTVLMVVLFIAALTIDRVMPGCRAFAGDFLGLRC